MPLPQPTKQKEVQKYIHRKHHFHLDLPELSMLLAFVAVAAGALYVTAINPEAIQVPQARGSIFMNEEGEYWREPVGRGEFRVAQTEETLPRFISITIDPMDVAPGETQSMEVVLEDDVEIASVIAEIQTDAGTETVPLEFYSRRAVTDIDKANEKYKVVDGRLSVVETPSPKDALGIMWRTLFSKAHATDRERFVYRGSWLVKNTHKTTYITKFIARDVLGRETTDTMAWSDSCAIPASGQWTILQFGAGGNPEACTLNRTDGAQGGPIVLEPGTRITLNGFVLGFNGGASGDIRLSAGPPSALINISLNGAEIRQGNTYVRDFDGDMYSDPDVLAADYFVVAGPPPAGMVRKDLARQSGSPSSFIYDCYGNNPNARPGQTRYFGYPRGSTNMGALSADTSPAGLSFDFNCDGNNDDSGGWASRILDGWITSNPVDILYEPKAPLCSSQVPWETKNCGYQEYGYREDVVRVCWEEDWYAVVCR